MVDDEERDEPEERPRRRERTEGVRIVGAQEAKRAFEEGRASPRRAEGEPRFGDRPEAPEPPETPAARFPLPEDRSPVLAPREPLREPGTGGPGRLGPRAGMPEPETVEDRPTGSMELPHWREPPSGEVPRLPGREATDEEIDAAIEELGPAPRFRDSELDWAEVDEGVAGLAPAPDEEALGALAEPEDEDEAFERRVEERRGLTARRIRTTPTARRSRHAGAPADAAEADRPAAAPGGPRRPGLVGEGQLEPGVAAPPAVDQGTGGGPRDLPTAIVTGVAVAILALLVFKWGRGPTAWMVAVIAALASAEVYAVLRARGYRPATPLGLVGTGAVVLVSYDRGFEGFPLVFALVAVFSLLWFLVEAEKARPAGNVAMTLFPVAYIGTLAGFGGLILAFPDGIGILLGTVIAAVAYDVAGYAIGSRIGTRRIAPRISPNKTLEGLLGGMTAAIVASVVFAARITPWDTGSAVLLGLVVAVTAPLGDLCESMLKRDMGVKDFGNLLPGHGGMLDRFDAILFVLPAVFYLVRIQELF